MKHTMPLGKRILVVDDEALLREALRQLLGLDQHVVVDAANGLEALELFRSSGPFDLVITDYTMPLMNGCELATKIRGLAPKQPILMITAYSSELKTVDHCADLVLKKPFTLEDLRRALAKLAPHL
jgi:CheY-like chemotaxis protein